jgi:hypothetical protein
MRLLVATGEVVADPGELPPLVRAVLRSASDVLVMTPVLVSGLRWIASDTDGARYEADERLARDADHSAFAVDDSAPRVTRRYRGVGL